MMLERLSTERSEKDSRSRGREVHEDVLLRLLLDRGPISRPELARRANLSKPSVSTILDAFVSAGIAEVVGSIQGRSGPAAALFRVRPNAAFSFGVDLRSTKMTCVLGDLEGTVIAERSIANGSNWSESPTDLILGLCKELISETRIEPSRIGHLAVAIPGTIDPMTGVGTSTHTVGDFKGIESFRSIRDELGVSVSIDNDVNMAAEAERNRSNLPNLDNFAYMTVGTGLALGLVIDGELRRGNRGAAGEIGFLPFGFDPYDRRHQVHGPLEDAVTGKGILARFAELRAREIPTNLAPDADVPTLFVAAESGDPLAAYLVDDEARLLALAIMSTTAVVDPGLIVLGGGIGEANGLLERVQSWCERLSLNPPLIIHSALGNRATLLGALDSAVLVTRNQLLDLVMR